jgi:ABC-type multidrug transport system ATPase subunit
MTTTTIQVPQQPKPEQGTQAVRVRNLSKELDGRVVLRGIDLAIEAGEFVGLLGANGAGKSTLLRIMATLIPPTDGSIELFGVLRPAVRSERTAKAN